MKTPFKILFLTLFGLALNFSKASASPITNGKDNDTSNLKSNIVIFKLMTSPTPSSSAPKGKTLKKAGSVARTSSNIHSEVTTKPVVPEG